jgi:hypothetical protein
MASDDKPAIVGTEILQRLYDSEINASITWMYDAGFDWKLGDDANGWKAQGTGRTIEDAARQLASAAMTTYPASEFAAWWAGA